MTINRLLIIAISLIATCLLGYFMVAPKYQEFSQLQTTLGSKEAEYNAKYVYYAEVNRVFNELSKRKDSLDKINNALPNNLSLSPLIYYLQKKSSESGLVIKNLFFTKASASTPNNPLREVVFSMNVIGGYPALKSLLASLEKSANLFEVNSVSFNSPLTSKISQIAQSYSFTLEVNTHSY